MRGFFDGDDDFWMSGGGWTGCGTDRGGLSRDNFEKDFVGFCDANKLVLGLGVMGINVRVKLSG